MTAGDSGSARSYHSGKSGATPEWHRRWRGRRRGHMSERQRTRPRISDLAHRLAAPLLLVPAVARRLPHPDDATVSTRWSAPGHKVRHDHLGCRATTVRPQRGVRDRLRGSRCAGYPAREMPRRRSRLVRDLRCLVAGPGPAFGAEFVDVHACMSDQASADAAPSRITPSSRCPELIEFELRATASRKASSRTFLARLLKRM